MKIDATTPQGHQDFLDCFFSTGAHNSEKYQLKCDVEVYLGYDTMIVRSGKGFSLRGDTIKFSRGYTWDGSSGPAIDTPYCMLASAVHDAVCSAIKEEFTTSGTSVRTAQQLLRIANDGYRMHCTTATSDLPWKQRATWWIRWRLRWRALQGFSWLYVGIYALIATCILLMVSGCAFTVTADRHGWRVSAGLDVGPQTAIDLYREIRTERESE